MSGFVNEARPRGRHEIRNYAQLVRQIATDRLGNSGPYFPIVDFVERVLVDGGQEARDSGVERGFGVLNTAS
jgi:hypothetical protein